VSTAPKGRGTHIPGRSVPCLPLNVIPLWGAISDLSMPDEARRVAAALRLSRNVERQRHRR
jgi:hypothetical protein